MIEEATEEVMRKLGKKHCGDKKRFKTQNKANKNIRVHEVPADDDER